MDICDVGELTNIVKKKTKVTDKEFYSIAATALDALVAFHSTNPPTVHGDIKRENVLIKTVRDPNEKVPPKKIGVVIDAQGAFRPGRGECLELFTAMYLSPEALLAGLHVITGLPDSPPPQPGPPLDVWAMGCTLYEARTCEE